MILLNQSNPALCNLANIDQFDWNSYVNKEYSYISIDSEVIKYLKQSS